MSFLPAAGGVRGWGSQLNWRIEKEGVACSSDKVKEG